MDDFALAAFREREAKQIWRRRAFFVHAAIFGAVNALIFTIWVLAGAGFPWFLFPLMGWGVGLVAHGASAYLLSDPNDIVLEREQRRMAERDRATG